MFDRLIHADWSVDGRKRWMTSAKRKNNNWQIGGPIMVGSTRKFLDDICAMGKNEKVLIGFDFPLGLPNAYGIQTGLQGFKEILSSCEAGEWRQFTTVADTPDEVSLCRPFYPRVPRKGVKRKTLIDRLGVQTFDELLRICERPTKRRQAACSVFWTLGGNQVGKAAITGWLEIIRPAMTTGARIWPFDGPLSELCRCAGVIFAETYPAEAVHVVQASFLRGESKRRSPDRKAKAQSILTWIEFRRLKISEEARSAVRDGFGSDSSGEDQFDSFVGLLKMIEVCDGRLPEMSFPRANMGSWEGWILGL